MVRRGGLVALCLLLPQWAMALTVTMSVEPQRVRPGESLVVTYQIDGQVGQAGQPDFTPLQQDFEIVDRRQSQNIAIVDGQATYELIWDLVLMPRRTGELSLPAIGFGGVSSEARTIRVVEEVAGAGGEPEPAGAPADETSGSVQVEYSVDDPTPYPNQQVLLTTQVYTAVDVDDLGVSAPRVVKGQADIDKLGRVREYQAVRGGRRYTVHEQRYTLVPRSSGVIELSRLEVTGRINGERITRRANPPRIEVITATASGSRKEEGLNPDDLFVELEVDKRSPYVQEQVMFTVRLFRAVSVENARLSVPGVSGGDAVIERLGDDREFQTARNDRTYAVTERRFVLFPQTSGALTLKPVRLQASIPVAHGGSTSGFWSRPLTRPVRIQSESYEFEVRKPPDGAPRPWLPAGSLTVNEEWPERDDFEVGAPITRRITVTAEEMLASQLPVLETPLPDTVKGYPEKPRRSNSAGDHGATGRLEQTVTLIPSRPGTYSVPAFELSWWNTRLDRPETAQLPAHVFEVTAAPGSAPSGGTSAVAATQADAAETPARSPVAWWLSLALGLAWMVTLVLWWLDRRRGLAVSTGRATVDADTRRRAVKRLQAACRSGDPGAVRDALLAWGRAHWPDRPPRSLGALAAVVDEPLASEITGLQRALYAPGGAAWQGDALYRAAAACRPVVSNDHTAPVLKPLYQH